MDTPYHALLQANETKCTLDCGCILNRPFPGTAAITYCGVHDAASDMLEALHSMMELAHPDKASSTEDFAARLNKARAAIAKATGKA